MADRRNDYTYVLIFGGNGGCWHIYRRKDDGHFPSCFDEENAVWSFPYEESHDDYEGPPPEVRAKYEELIGYDPEYDPGSLWNLVEMVSDEPPELEQVCAFGSLVEGHAVYCHNSQWLYSPRKCRRSWYTGGTIRDEDCEGFAPNPRLAQGIEARQGEDGTASSPDESPVAESDAPATPDELAAGPQGDE